MFLLRNYSRRSVVSEDGTVLISSLDSLGKDFFSTEPSEEDQKKINLSSIEDSIFGVVDKNQKPIQNLLRAQLSKISQKSKKLKIKRYKQFYVFGYTQVFNTTISFDIGELWHV